MPQNLGVILRKTTGFGGLGPCPLDAQWKNKEFKKKILPRGPPKLFSGSEEQTDFCTISSYSKLKSKGDDVIPIDGHVTSEEEKRKLSYILPYSKLQFQKKISSNSKKNSKCHISHFLAPETKCHKMQVILYRVSKRWCHTYR